jgi:hypothetical protein
MVLTPAEKSRQWRERRKSEREVALRELRAKVREDFRKPFGEYYLDHPQSSDVDLALELAGYNPPDFTDDRGPEAFAMEDAIAGVDDPFRGAVGALGRADAIVGLLIDATSELARIVSDYKKAEIRARIAEAEESDLSDTATRKAALAEIVRLNKILDQLNKRVRRDFPQWEIRGT